MRTPSKFSTVGLALFASVSLSVSSHAAVSLTNGNFETVGSLTVNALGGMYSASGWNLVGDSLSGQASAALADGSVNAEFNITNPSPYPNGNRYLRLVSDGLNSESPELRGQIAQSVGIMVANDTYTLKADIFGNAAPVGYGATISLVSVSDTSGSRTVYATQTVSGVLGGVFTADAFNFSYTASAADDGKELIVLLQAQYNDSWSTCTRGGLDNLRLTSVPEPSAAVLGLGSLLLMIRRRR